jgi:hypothetical protein
MSSSIGQKSIYELSPQEKALLLATVKTHRKERGLDYITAAEIFQRTPSNQELARVFHTTARLVGMFKSLLSLPEDIKDYVRTGKISSLDKAVRIASLKDTGSQLFLAKAILTDPATFTAPTVSKIVTLKNRNKDMSIEECVEKVLKSKPIVENRYVLVTAVEKALSQTGSEKATEEGISFSDFVKKTIRQILPSDDSLLSIMTHNGMILLTLTAEGWQALRQKSGNLGVPLDELVETLLKLALSKG